MPTGFGMAQDAQGNGTTPEDLQRIFGAMFYNDGLMHGGKVTGTTSMHYNVSAGAGNIKTGNGMLILVPIQATRVPAPAAPSTGTATHTIYVKQNFPASDGDNNVVVACTAGAAPENSLILDKFTIKAGATNTRGAASVHDVRFSRPVGSSLGRLSHATLAPRVAYSARQPKTWGQQKFYVPHDANIDVRLTTTLMRSNANGVRTGTTHNNFLKHLIYIDGVLRNGISHAITGEKPAMRFFTTPEWVSEGSHTLHVVTSDQSDELEGLYHYAGLQDYANGWHGTHVSVDHMGMRV